MKEVYESEYAQMLWWQENKVLEVTWFEATEKMNQDIFKQETLSMLEVQLQLKPKYMISDARNMFYVIVPELQYGFTKIMLYPLLPKVCQ